jgi:hypothetical protein
MHTPAHLLETATFTDQTTHSVTELQSVLCNACHAWMHEAFYSHSSVIDHNASGTFYAHTALACSVCGVPADGSEPDDDTDTAVAIRSSFVMQVTDVHDCHGCGEVIGTDSIYCEVCSAGSHR